MSFTANDEAQLRRLAVSWLVTARRVVVDMEELEARSAVWTEERPRDEGATREDGAQERAGG
jgi:hypothetical protein